MRNDNSAAASVDLIDADGKVIRSIKDVAHERVSDAKTVKDTLGCKLAGKSEYVGKRTVKRRSNRRLEWFIARGEERGWLGGGDINRLPLGPSAR